MIQDQADVKIGDKVHYNCFGGYDNGMVKSIPEHTTNAVFVVYKCGGVWEEFHEYTAELTELVDLDTGWRHD